MQRIGPEYTVQDPNGNAVPNATITVYDYSQYPTTPLAQVYEATGSLTSPAVKANPFTTDSLGRWAIALPDGRYTIKIEGGSAPAQIIERVVVTDTSITLPSPALGTVTSVALSLPAEFSVSGSPVTGTGTLTAGWASASGTGAQGKFIGTPSGGGAGTIAPRVLALTDLPAHGPTPSTSFGTAALIPVLTTNSQGIITGISTVPSSPAWSLLSGRPSTLISYALPDQVACVFRQTNSTTLGNSTTETNIIGTGQGSTTLAANQLTVGSTLRVAMDGYGGVSGGGTVQIKLKIGANTVIDTGTFTPITIVPSFPWRLELVYSVRTTGAGGTGIGQAFLVFTKDVNGTIVGNPVAITGTTTIDTTASNIVQVSWQWGTASANNTITVTNCRIFVEG